METNLDNSFIEKSWALIKTKVDQLNQLKNNPDSVQEMLDITKQLENLLRLASNGKFEKVVNAPSSKISVILPAVYNDVKTIVIGNKESEVVEQEIEIFEEKEEEIKESESTLETEKIVPDAVLLDTATEKIREEEQPVSEESAKPEIKEEAPIVVEEEKIPEPIIETPAMESIVAAELPADEPSTEKPVVIEETPSVKKQYSIWESYSSNDIPTLTHQNPIAETVSKPSTEEKADNTYVEPSSQPPIKDLKKAISINDRYLFINELFRGDESTYERSIKTINNFNIYQEAKYWIDRELKLKMGWDEKNAAVKQFNNLVVRRFA